MDELWVRKRARLLDLSGEEKKLRAEMDDALEEGAAAGRDRQNKALARKSDKELRLASIKLLEDATYEKLSSMRVKELDEQIDKLQELGGNKQAKIKELLVALENYRNSASGDLSSEASNNGTKTMEAELSETFDNGNCPEDLELCFDDELGF
ncbi:hypothetical protein B0J17DRAFT_734087 [Rhizoctonia solani]|nr:hypothetical protein B0J17DRAFT_734087 [Rhizoctonia solani]